MYLGILAIIIIIVLLKKRKPKIIEYPESKILNINYQKSGGKNYCLVACLSMYLDYYGYEISQNIIAKNIMKDDGSGANIQKAIRFMKQYNINLIFAIIETIDIWKYIYKDEPIIAVMGYKLTNKNDHARLIKGYKPNILITDDPSIRKNYELTYKEFEELSLVGTKKNYIHIIKKEK